MSDYRNSCGKLLCRVDLKKMIVEITIDGQKMIVEILDNNVKFTNIFYNN